MTDFQSAITAQTDRVAGAAERLSKTQDENHRALLASCDRLDAAIEKAREGLRKYASGADL